MKKQRLAVFLALWMAILPALPAFARRERPAAAMFHPEGQQTTLRKANGLEVRSALGHWHHGGRTSRGGDLAAVSAWGERLVARYVVSDGGFETVINERLSIFTTLDDYGNAVEMVVRADDEERKIHLASQAQRIARGGPFLTPPELAAYEILVQALLAEHSQEFWQALADEYQIALPAGCGLQVASCGLAVIGWIGSLSALVGLCGGAAASAGVLTPGCLGAILAHPTVSAGAALSCGQALSCIENQLDGAQGDESCTSPGGRE